MTTAQLARILAMTIAATFVIALPVSLVAGDTANAAGSEAIPIVPDASGPPQSEPEPSDDTTAIVEVIRHFLEAINTGDAAIARQVLVEEGLIHLLRLNPDGTTEHRTRTHAEEFEQLARPREQTYRERYWDPTIRHDNGVGVVSTPYDFWIDGEFSHCGTDIFTLAKIEGRWMITGVSFTMQAEGCPESPLGPLDG